MFPIRLINFNTFCRELAPLEETFLKCFDVSSCKINADIFEALIYMNWSTVFKQTKLKEDVESLPLLQDMV